MTTEMKLKEFSDRIEKLKQLKITKEAELGMLQQNYDTQVATLKSLGVEDLNNLPQLIADLEADITTKEAQLESTLTNLEKSLQ
jgi:hypothetical protein